jgi:hypothetical protein
VEEITTETCASRGVLDVAGGVISVACALHCLLLPIILPFAATFLHNPWLEVALMLSAIAVGGSALRHGYKIHGFRLPAGLFAAGMASILVGNWLLTKGHPLSEGHTHTPIQLLFVAIGGSAIVSSHIANFILERNRHKPAGDPMRGSLDFRKR